MALKYQAGSCNIGKHEINYRRKIVGYGSATVAVALYIMLVYFNFPLIIYSALFIPVFVSVHGFREAKKKFCTSYGRTGRYNMTSDVGMTQNVLTAAKRKKDAEYSTKLLNDSMKISGVLTILLIAASRIVN